MSEIISQEAEQIIQQFIGQYQLAMYSAVIAVMAAIGIGVAWVVYEKFFTPDESKFIRKAYRKKRALMAIGGDDGFMDLQNADSIGSEGILRTKGVGVTNEHFTGALPRPKEILASQIELKDKVKDKEATVAVANYISQIANRRLLLRGARVPVWFAYRGKAILASLYGLIALQVVEGLAAKEEFKSAFATIDVLAIKALFSQQWNQSQIQANETDAERKGELRSKKFGGKESLILIFALLIGLCVVAILVIAAAYFLGGGGGS